MRDKNKGRVARRSCRMFTLSGGIEYMPGLHKSGAYDVYLVFSGRGIYRFSALDWKSSDAARLAAREFKAMSPDKRSEEFNLIDDTIDRNWSKWVVPDCENASRHKLFLGGLK